MFVCVYTSIREGMRRDLEGFLEPNYHRSLCLFPSIRGMIARLLSLFFFFNKFPIFLPPRVEKKFVYLEFYYYLWLRSVDCDYYRRASSTTNLIFTSLLFLFDFFLRISNFLRYRKNHASSIFKSLPHSIKNNGALLSFLLLLLPEQMKFQSRSKPT